MHAEETRPNRKGSACTWSAAQMDELLRFLQTHAPKPPKDAPPLIAAISPHAAYGDAGPAYYPVFEQVSAPEVVIFGVTHRAIRDKLGQPQAKLILDTYAQWAGPYGQTRISDLRAAIQQQLGAEHILVNNEAQCLEHSIDSLLPFLQHARRDARLTPLMVTAMRFDTMDQLSAELAAVIAAYMQAQHLELGKDICFLISADANHYGEDFSNHHFGTGAEAHRRGMAHDRKLIEAYLQGEITPARIKGLTKELWGEDYKDYGNVVWCGQYSIPFGLLTVYHLLEKLHAERRLTGQLFLYGDSYTESQRPKAERPPGGTIPSTLEHWVGFFSAGFYLR